VRIVGLSVTRTDAWAKVVGQAKYASDLSMPGMLHLKLVLAAPLTAMQPGTPLIHPDPPGNIAHTVRLRRGDVEAGLAQAEVVIEREYRTPMQEHAFLEPEAGLGYIDELGRVTVITAGQPVHDDQNQVAAALDLPLEQVVRPE
jgi:CO/xanthine dehydrogenase Mo-binding subunit